MKRLFHQGKILKAEIRRNGYRFNFIAQKAGLPYGTFDAYLNERQGIPELTLRGILHKFPEFDRRLFSFDETNHHQQLSLSVNEKEAASA